MSREFTDLKTKQTSMGFKELKISEKCDTCGNYTTLLYANYGKGTPHHSAVSHWECGECMYPEQYSNKVVKTKDSWETEKPSVDDRFFGIDPESEDGSHHNGE